MFLSLRSVLRVRFEGVRLSICDPVGGELGGGDPNAEGFSEDEASWMEFLEASPSTTL